MLFNWFDHPLIQGWAEARLRAELHGEDAAPPEDRPLEWLEIPVIEPLPDVDNGSGSPRTRGPIR